MNCCCQVVSETSGATGESHNIRPLSASHHDSDNKVGVGNNYCINLSQLKTGYKDDMHFIIELKQQISVKANLITNTLLLL